MPGIPGAVTKQPAGFPTPRQNDGPGLGWELGVRNRSPGFFEFTAESSVGDGGVLVHVEYSTNGNHLREPAFVFIFVPRLGNAEPVFTEDDHWNRDFIGPREFLDRLAFTFRDGGKCIRVENQAHSSGSIFSNSSSISWLMRAVSLRK